MSKQLAIMSAPKYGMRDFEEPSFWFDVKFGENLSESALIVTNPAEMAAIIKEANTYDISQLEGSPCQIEIEKDTVHFVRILKK